MLRDLLPRKERYQTQISRKVKVGGTLSGHSDCNLRAGQILDSQTHTCDTIAPDTTSSYTTLQSFKPCPYEPFAHLPQRAEAHGSVTSYDRHRRNCRFVDGSGKFQKSLCYFGEVFVLMFSKKS